MCAISQAADCVAGKIELPELVGILAPNHGMRATLHDSEKHLARGIAMLREIVARSPRPGARPRGRVARARFRRGRRNAFIEHHDDVGAKRDFDFERFFGREKMLRAVKVRAERDAFVAHSAQIAEAEHLVAARIGKNCVRPRHEPMQPTHFADKFVAGPKIKMIRVGEQNLDAKAF